MWNEHPELADSADAAGPRANRIAACTYPVVLRLDVKSIPEVESVAIVVKLRSNSLTSAKHEIDAIAASQGCAGKRGHGDATRPMLGLFPVQLPVRARANGHTDDEALLDGHDSDPRRSLRFLFRPREQRGQQGQERIIQGSWTVIASRQCQGSIEQSMNCCKSLERLAWGRGLF